jgi:hypothetical protein
MKPQRTDNRGMPITQPAVYWEQSPYNKGPIENAEQGRPLDLITYTPISDRHFAAFEHVSRPGVPTGFTTISSVNEMLRLGLLHPLTREPLTLQNVLRVVDEGEGRFVISRFTRNEMTRLWLYEQTARWGLALAPVIIGAATTFYGHPRVANAKLLSFRNINEHECVALGIVLGASTVNLVLVALSYIANAYFAFSSALCSFCSGAAAAGGWTVIREDKTLVVAMCFTGAVLCFLNGVLLGGAPELARSTRIGHRIHDLLHSPVPALPAG